MEAEAASVTSSPTEITSIPDFQVSVWVYFFMFIDTATGAVCAVAFVLVATIVALVAPVAGELLL